MSEVRVTKRKGSGTFYVDLRGLGGGRKSLGTTDSRVARARLGEAVAVLGGPTLREAHLRMMAKRWRAQKSPPEKQYRSVASILGDSVRLGEIDSDRLELLVTESRIRGAGPATINRRLAYLRVLLRDAYQRQPREIDAVPPMPMQREPQGRQVVVDQATEDAIVAQFRAMGRPDLARLVIVAVDTGMRLSELLRLRAGDIRGDVAVVGVTKSGQPRHVPLTARALAACQEGLWQDLTVHKVEHYWVAMRTALGRPELVFHALRHTCCTRLVAKGMDLARVKKWMGHQAIATTMRYEHVGVEDLKALRDALQ